MAVLVLGVKDIIIVIVSCVKLVSLSCVSVSWLIFNSISIFAKFCSI